jgi:hypothetical protein
MPTKIACTNADCQELLHVKDELAGTSIQCPRCEQLLYVPVKAESESPADTDEALGFLEEVEAAFRRMIVGIFRFIFIRLPTWIYELFQHFFDWLGRFLRYMVRLGIRVVRVLFFATIWALLVFGPLSFVLSWPTLNSPTFTVCGLAWAVIGLIGSVWGVNRWWHRRATRFADSETSPRPAPALVRTLSWLLILTSAVVVVWGCVTVYSQVAQRYGAQIPRGREQKAPPPTAATSVRPDVREAPQVINDQLTTADVRDVRRNKASFCKVYRFRLVFGRTYTIDLKSHAFDTYLRLEEEGGATIAENDDISPGIKNSRLSFTPTATRVYRLIATTCVGNKVGPFTLEVR